MESLESKYEMLVLSDKFLLDYLDDDNLDEFLKWVEKSFDYIDNAEQVTELIEVLKSKMIKYGKYDWIVPTINFIDNNCHV